MGDDLGDEWWDNAGRSDVSEAEQEKEEKIQPIETAVKLNKRVKKRTCVTPEKPPNSKKKKTVEKKTSAAVERKGGDGDKSTKPTIRRRRKKETSIAVDNKEEVGNKSTKPKIRPKKETSVSVEKKEDNGDKSTKPKKRRKKKTITDVLASSDPKPGCPADLQGLIAQYFSDKRSVIELEELKLQDSCFLSSNDLTHTLSSYLKQICPKWAKVHKQHTEKSSVVLLIVCCSALRTIELIKQLPAFKGEGKVLKLFAKHIKVEEQLKLLQKGVTHIGVGTPARLSALIEKDGLNLSALRYLVLDWNWRDQKLRRMADVPEVKVDLLKLLESGVMSACRDGKVKIGLF